MPNFFENDIPTIALLAVIIFASASARGGTKSVVHRIGSPCAAVFEAIAAVLYCLKRVNQNHSASHCVPGVVCITGLTTSSARQ